MRSGYECLGVELRGNVARVRLDRPPVNALNRALVAELQRLALELRGDPAVWVVVLEAAGHVFCAGADLKERRAMPEARVAAAVRAIQRMVHAWIRLPQPLVAAVQGAALGGGLELALSADIVAASRAARLGFPEVRLGIIPAATGTQRLAQRTTLGVANKWVLSGETFAADEALRDGVVDYVFPAGSFESDLEGLVSRLAAGAPLALRQAKKALHAHCRERLRRGLALETACYAPLIRTKDRREALEAFQERRSPRWRGQ